MEQRRGQTKNNQFGGELQASSTHLLVEVLSDITAGLEDNWAGVVLSAIDFSKAFNRLDHSKCLAAFAEKGSSTQVLKLLAGIGFRMLLIQHWRR